MLLALGKNTEPLRILRLRHCRPRLSHLCSRAPSHLPISSRLLTSLAQQNDITMAGPEGKESKPSRGAVTLKTPKGTRDWNGPDMLLRDEVLCVSSSEQRARPVS